jgi:tetratricopeptide (TPR) repeat protein
VATPPEASAAAAGAAGSGSAGQDKTGQDKTGQDKAAQDKAAQDKAGQDKAGQDKAAQDKTGQDKAAQDKAAQDKAAQDKAAQDKAAQDKAAQDKAAQAKTLIDQANDAIAEGAFDRALRAADSSIAIKKSPRAYLARAKALQRIDRVDEALGAIDAAEKLAPKYASVFELRGHILWAVRRRDEARVQFQKFLELESTGPRADKIQKLLAEPR